MKKAMIFAAGLGTRLRPLTNSKPKALVKVGGVPLLEIAIKRLKYFGFNNIIINVHHFRELIYSFLEEHKNFGINIRISDEKDKILETGGGLKKAAHFFKDTNAFLVYNTDIISNIDLNDLYNTHLKNDGIATLAVRNRETSRYLVFDDNDLLHGWMNIKTKQLQIKRLDSEKLNMFAFSGIHILSPKIFDRMPSKDVFSIIETYRNIAGNDKLYAYNHNDDFWLDVGKPSSLEKANDMLDFLKRENIIEAT